MLHVSSLSLAQLFLRQEVQRNWFAILVIVDTKFSDKFNRDLDSSLWNHKGLHRLHWSSAMRPSFHIYLVQLQLSLYAIYILFSWHLFWTQNLYRDCERIKFVELSSLPIPGIDIFVLGVTGHWLLKPISVSSTLEE